MGKLKILPVSICAKIPSMVSVPDPAHLVRVSWFVCCHNVTISLFPAVCVPSVLGRTHYSQSESGFFHTKVSPNVFLAKKTSNATELNKMITMTTAKKMVQKKGRGLNEDLLLEPTGRGDLFESV